MEIIKENIVQREKNWRYYIDRKGNLVRKKERAFFNIWTLITILIILASYSYYSEIKLSRQFIDSPCVKKCLVQDYITNFKNDNPNIQVICDDKGNCQFSGVINEELKKQIELISSNFSVNQKNV
jgi:hypothetical protein